MAGLGVAQVLWLLGQDQQWMRPRAGVFPVAAATGALVDVIAAGAARWVDDDEGEVAVESCDFGPLADGLVHTWANLLGAAAQSGPIRVIHAINAVSPSIWDRVAADLASSGYAEVVPRPMRRWLSPRRRPQRNITERTRTHLLDVVHRTTPAAPQDHAVLAVASCAGVVEHILSRTAFTDSSVLEPTEAFLDGSDLVRRLTPAVSYLVSFGPALGRSQ